MEQVKTIKVFWNGIKIDGDKTLIKCEFNIDGFPSYHDKIPELGAPVEISDPSSYDFRQLHNERLRNIFQGEDDEGNKSYNGEKYIFSYITPDCPLYEYFFAAGIKAKIHFGESQIRWNKKRGYSTEKDEARKRELEEILPKVGAAVPADKIRAFEDWKRKKANEVRDEHLDEHLAEEARAEARYQLEKSYRKTPLEGLKKTFPIEGEKYSVLFEWSESPSIEEGERMSFTAAETYIAFLESVHKEHGYDKTRTIIINNESGEKVYILRRDIGDYKGKLVGIIGHIEDYVNYCAGENAAEYFKMTAEEVAEMREFIADLKRSKRKGA